jgi:nicotinate phosphoribosyltransferase
MKRVILQHPTEASKHRSLAREEIQTVEPLLVTVLEEGKAVGDSPTIQEMRVRRQADVDRLDPGVKRFVNPHVYHVSLTVRVWNRKQGLVESAREESVAIQQPPKLAQSP